VIDQQYALGLWETLLIAFGGPLIMSALLAWLIPTFISHRLARHLIEHETVFAHLYVKQSEAISKLYENFVKAEDGWVALSINTPADPSQRADLAQQFARDIRELAMHFKFNRVWLPRKLAKELTPLLKAYEVADPAELPRRAELSRFFQYMMPRMRSI
jgi:hypothetical protein